MRLTRWLALLALLSMGLLTSCAVVVDERDLERRIDLTVQYEKRALSPSGFGGLSTRPARYCYVEIRNDKDNKILTSGYLDRNGQASFNLIEGTAFYVLATTEWSVPATGGSGSDWFMMGSVVKSALQSNETSESFNKTSDWYVSGVTRVADRDGSYILTALDDQQRIAGAFNIADQAVSYALMLQNLNPQLRLPNLHTYWTTEGSGQKRTNPKVLKTPQGQVYVPTNSSGQKLRALFVHQVYGLQGGAGTETDEWDDGVLQQCFAHQLFADYSYKNDGSSVLSFLRRDNDPVEPFDVSRDWTSEPTVAFAEGFSDFMAGAALNSSQILDSYKDNSGILRVDVLDLASHNLVPQAKKSEVTRGSIAVSLWNAWKRAMGGGTSGLQTFWNALNSNTALPDGSGEYNGATLGCYPSYLLGLRSRAMSAWPAIDSELAAEGIPDITASNYFNENRMYKTLQGLPAQVNGTLRFQNGLYYDEDQSLIHRFYLNGKRPVTVSMNPESGVPQDFYVELLGPGGLWDGRYTPKNSAKSFTTAALDPGWYAVRVRVGDSAATGTYGYRLSIQ